MCNWRNVELRQWLKEQINNCSKYSPKQLWFCCSVWMWAYKFTVTCIVLYNLSPVYKIVSYNTHPGLFLHIISFLCSLKATWVFEVVDIWSLTSTLKCDWGWVLRLQCERQALSVSHYYQLRARCRECVSECECVQCWRRAAASGTGTRASR